MPNVSVIVPAYNPGPFLDLAIRSVIAQTFTGWECIVVDDGSTEGLSRVEKMDPRVRLIRQPNRGVSAARNNAIMNSTCEFIAFLDADDLYHPDKLALQVAALAARPDVGYLHTGFRYVDSSGEEIGPGTANARGDYLRMLRGGEVLCPTAMVRRADILHAGLFDPLLVCGEDADFALRIARGGSLVEFLPDVLYDYRRHPANATGDYMRVYRQMDEVFRRHAVAAALRGDARAYKAAGSARRRNRRAAGLRAYDSAREQLGDRRISKFVASLGTSLRLAPRYTLQNLIRYTLRG